MGRVPDVRRCVTMDLKEPGNLLYLIGATRDEMGGSHYHLVHGLTGGVVPQVDLAAGAAAVRAGARRRFAQGLVRACHDLSEGGLAVALAEMAFAGGVGADVTGFAAPGLSDEAALFSESTTRFLVEVRPDRTAAFEACLRSTRRSPGADGQGGAAADRGRQRRVGRVGGVGRAEGGMAEAAAVVRGDHAR